MSEISESLDHIANHNHPIIQNAPQPGAPLDDDLITNDLGFPLPEPSLPPTKTYSHVVVPSKNYSRLHSTGGSMTKTIRSSRSSSEWSPSRPRSSESETTFRDSDTEITDWESIRPERIRQLDDVPLPELPKSLKGDLTTQSFLSPPAYSDIVPEARHSDTQSLSSQGSLSLKPSTAKIGFETLNFSGTDRKMLRSALERARLAVHYDKKDDLKQAVQFYQMACDQLSQVQTSRLDFKGMMALADTVSPKATPTKFVIDLIG